MGQRLHLQSPTIEFAGKHGLHEFTSIRPIAVAEKVDMLRSKFTKQQNLKLPNALIQTDNELAEKLVMFWFLTRSDEDGKRCSICDKPEKRRWAHPFIQQDVILRQRGTILSIKVPEAPTFIKRTA